MELTDRETLIKVEQQLKDAIKNHGQIIVDLKGTFQRIEQESKVIASCKAELNTHLEIDGMRDKEIVKKLDNITYQYDELTKSFDQSNINFLDEISKEREERKKDLNDEKTDRIREASEERLKRETFTTEIRATTRIIKWFFCGIPAVLSIISIALAILTFMK